MREEERRRREGKIYIERKKYRKKKTRKEHRERKEKCARYRETERTKLIMCI